jgi:hypothetical protein
MVEKNRAGSGRMRIGFHAFRIAISCPFLQVTGGINDAAAGFHCGTWGSGGLGGACTLVHPSGIEGLIFGSWGYAIRREASLRRSSGRAWPWWR